MNLNLTRNSNEHTPVANDVRKKSFLFLFWEQMPDIQDNFNRCKETLAQSIVEILGQGKPLKLGKKARDLLLPTHDFGIWLEFSRGCQSNKPPGRSNG